MAQDTILGSDTVYTALTTKINGDMTELFAIKTEVEDARDGALNLLAQVNSLQSSISSLTTGSGCPISSNDTAPGYLNGKLVAGEGVDLTEGNDGGNETLIISCENASATNKGAASFNAQDFSCSEGVVSASFSRFLFKSADYSITSEDTHGNTIIWNGASINVTLPDDTASACFIRFFVWNESYLKITAPGTRVISNGSLSSAAGGYIRSATPRDSVTIYKPPGATNYHVWDIKGSWKVDE